jgi:hypothetical protein
MKGLFNKQGLKSWFMHILPHPPPPPWTQRHFLSLLLVNLHHGLLAPLIGPFPFPQPCGVCFLFLLKPQRGLLV